MHGLNEAEILAVEGLMKMSWDVRDIGWRQQQFRVGNSHELGNIPDTWIYSGEHLRSALLICKENKESLEILPASVQGGLEFPAGFLENEITAVT